jgi:hypothetical protein
VRQLQRLCYGGRVFGLNFGEWWIVTFLLLTIFVAPWSGRAGQYVARLLVSKKQP